MSLIFLRICFTGEALLLPGPPPPLRETIFSTEIRSVEYEKPEEQRETVLFDDIGDDDDDDDDGGGGIREA